jgi:hypothetical protein
MNPIQTVLQAPMPAHLAAQLAEWRRVAPVMCVDNGPGRASFRFRLGRFFPSRVVHVGDAALADALALADRYRRCVGFERRRNTVGRLSRFVVNGVAGGAA